MIYFFIIITVMLIKIILRIIILKIDVCRFNITNELTQNNFVHWQFVRKDCFQR